MNLKILLSSTLLSVVSLLLVGCQKEDSLNSTKDSIIGPQLISQGTFNESYIDEFTLPNSGFQNYIDTKTNWSLFYNGDNQYTYSFNEEGKYPTISITFENINSNLTSVIHEEDIEVIQSEGENGDRTFGRVNIPKLGLVGTYNGFALKKEKNGNGYQYSLLNCWGKNEMDESKAFPYGTGVIEFSKDHTYAYNNHVQTGGTIDASKFFNMIITTYQNFPNECIIDIDKVSNSKYLKELPIKLGDSFSNGVIAILKDNEGNLFCKGYSSQDSNEILFTNGEIICGLTIQQGMKFEKLYIK